MVFENDSKSSYEHPTFDKSAFESIVGKEFVGSSSAILKVFESIQRVADTDSTVLICGESGTGKELVAKAIHKLSARKNNSLVPVNCGAIPAELLESELFGHVKGSFTGAISNRQGRFEVAQGGSIFLDEIGDMPAMLQVKLLRVLQERQFEPVGSAKTLQADVRIIAATNKDLEIAVKDKSFREDLFYRLNVIPIHMPALRERKSDIPMLVEHFSKRFNIEKRRNVRFDNQEVIDLLLRYDWPGNIRELENLVERLVVFANDRVELKDLPSKIFERVQLEQSKLQAQGKFGFGQNGAYSSTQSIFSNADFSNGFPKLSLPEDGLDLREIVNAFENDLLMQALSRTKGNKNKASELLRMNRTTLVEKLKKKNLQYLDN